MRQIVFAVALAWAGPAFSQSFDGSINSTLFGSLNSGISSGLNGGIASGFGPQTRSRAILDADRFDPTSGRDAFLLLEQERRGLNVLGCAPGQVDLNRTGCVPVREALTRPLSTYDRSLQGLAPLTGLTIDQTLPLGAGPRNSID